MIIEKGWWELKFFGIEQLTDTDKEHIGQCIKDGFTNGETIQEIENELQKNKRFCFICDTKINRDTTIKWNKMGEPVCENCYEKTKGRGETTELKKEGCDKCGGDTTITHRKIGNCTVLMNEFCTDCGYNWTRKR